MPCRIQPAAEHGNLNPGMSMEEDLSGFGCLGSVDNDASGVTPDSPSASVPHGICESEMSVTSRDIFEAEASSMTFVLDPLVRFFFASQRV